MILLPRTKIITVSGYLKKNWSFKHLWKWKLTIYTPTTLLIFCGHNFHTTGSCPWHSIQTSPQSFSVLRTRQPCPENHWVKTHTLSLISYLSFQLCACLFTHTVSLLLSAPSESSRHVFLVLFFYIIDDLNCPGIGRINTDTRTEKVCLFDFCYFWLCQPLRCLSLYISVSVTMLSLTVC